jgi:ABC-2 type transport system ATP-binding protein
VESICTRCIVIHRGKLIADEPMASLKNKLHARHEVFVRFAGRVPVDALRKRWTHAIPASEDHSFLIRDEDPLLSQKVYRWAVENQLVLNELKWVENKMEDIFYSLTGQASGEAH